MEEVIKELEEVMKGFEECKREMEEIQERFIKRCEEAVLMVKELG